MKNYPHIWQKVFNEPWAILPSSYDSIRETLLAQMHGREFAALGKSEFAALGLGRESNPSKPFADAPNGTAIVTIDGIIGKRLSMMEALCGGCDLDQVRIALLAAAESRAHENIIIYAHTPGGQVVGTPEFADLVYDITMHSGKQVFGYTDTMCCSAGYWALSQCHEFLAAPSAIVGSIGVVRSHVDQSAKDEQDGIRYTTIKSGKYKDTGNPHRALTDDEIARAQESVNARAAEFFAAVNRVRPEVDCLGLEADVLSGSEALAANLVDSNFDTIDDLLEALS